MNYLLEIENEYSRLRGRASRLSPVDWQLADNWQQSGVPLWLILRAMGDVVKKFSETKRPDTINSLNYFRQEVQKQFAEWQTSQIGKSSEPFTPIEEKNMQSNFTALACSDEIDILEYFVDALANKTNLPEPLKSAVANLRGELLLLIDDTKQKQLVMDDIESRLSALAKELELSLAVSVTDDERAALLETVKTEYGKFTLTDELRQKVLIRKLYDRFGLPQMSLYAL